MTKLKVKVNYEAMASVLKRMRYSIILMEKMLQEDLENKKGLEDEATIS